jgi:ribosome-associated translation inhibitor RaiA/cold shock CspA family protein
VGAFSFGQGKAGDVAMQMPLEIAFHNMQPSDAVEAEIRKRTEKLDKMYDRLVGCRVSVEGLHKQHRTGNIYEVHIELMVPGQNLVVSREPHKAKERYANPDVYASLREAFKAAERQLKDYKERQRGEVKPHDAMLPGRVAQLVPDQDHGFLVTPAGTQLYFHRNSVMDGFDQLKPGDPVNFVETTGDTGPTASKVWRGPANPN